VTALAAQTDAVLTAVNQKLEHLAEDTVLIAVEN